MYPTKYNANAVLYADADTPRSWMMVTKGRRHHHDIRRLTVVKPSSLQFIEGQRLFVQIKMYLLGIRNICPKD